MTLETFITERIIALRRAKENCELPRDKTILQEINARLGELESLAISFGFYPREHTNTTSVIIPAAQLDEPDVAIEESWEDTCATPLTAKEKYVVETEDGKELCPICGNEVILDDYTLHNCGWDARWCRVCQATYYLEDKEDE